MPRVAIELPERFPFATEIPIRVTDLNYGGHLGNDAVLSVAHEARVRFLASHGWTEKDAGGAGIILADAAVVYRAEGFYGMVLRVEIAVDDLRTRSCDLLYRITDVDGGKEIARVKTGVLFFDYSTRRVVSIPAAVRAGLQGPAT
jgi:acyl-CoA thioesterase FadM